MFTYSVIIPHKNCVPLLLRCFNSIPVRDDIQVVIVDDVSTLTEEEHAQLESLRSSRVQVLFLETTHFAGGARNEGLALAEGRWLVFADSDDFFTEEAFKVMDDWKDSAYDMVFFAHESRLSDSLEQTVRSDERSEYVQRLARDKGDKQADEMLRYQNPVPWARMVRRELVETHHLQFDCVRASNDAMFALYAGYYAQSVAADNRITYCVTVREGSLTRTTSRESAYCRYEVAVRKYCFLRDHNLDHMLPWLTARVWGALRHYGFSEFRRYYRLARANHVNIWLGITQRFHR